MELLQENTVAPAFTAQATSGETISLSDFIGKKNVVLYFYPEDDTSGCTIEACAFRDDWQKFVSADTMVLGVSLDTVDSHKRFTDKFNLNFPLLADVEGKICADYGVEVRGNWPKRITYIIGKDGMIKRVYPKVDVRIHSEEILETLKSIG